MSDWNYGISTRPTYAELKAQHQRWLSRQRLQIGALKPEDFMRWTEVRLAVVREMYAAGHPLKLIARALGPTFTAHMVNGVVERLGLPRRNGKKGA